MDTMFSCGIGLCCALYLLLLDIVSTNPTPLVIEEPIPYPMKNNIINNLYGKVRHAFSYQ